MLVCVRLGRAAGACLQLRMALIGAATAPRLVAAGIDEAGLLGEKKRRKVLSVVKETDVAVIVVDAARFAG